MLFISYRRDFWSDRRLSEHDAIRDIDMQTGVETELDETKFAKRIKGKRLMLLIHGYRNSRVDILCAYGQLQEEFASIPRSTTGTGLQEYQEVIGIAWPGYDWRIEFTPAKASADATAPKFFARLRSMADSASAVDVMTHSLGARVGLRTLQNAGAATKPVRNLFLTAPAVDDESIEQNEKFFFSTERCSKVLVMHSKKDPVLEFFYPIPILGGGGPALGHKGPKHPAKVGPNVSSVDCSPVVSAHGDYRKRSETYQFVATVVAGGPIPSKLSPGVGPVLYDCAFKTDDDD